MVIDDKNPWFEPKRYGYGAGLPIVWQGWALLAAYLLVVLGSALFLAERSPIAFVLIVLLATVILLPICAAKTRGGWRWRWRKGD